MLDQLFSTEVLMKKPETRAFRDSDLTETTVSSEKIFEGHIIKVFRDTVSLPDGELATREVVRHNGAVCVVPITDNGEILAVRQYRYALGEVTLEIPAGKIDPGEDPETAALRELAEETGFNSDKLISLGKLHTSVGFCDEVIHMYAAVDLKEYALSPDEDEYLTLTSIPMDEFEDMVINGEITDAKTQSGVLKVCVLCRRGEL